MNRNYFIPKKQYSNDIKFLNDKFGDFMEEKFQRYLEMKTTYKSTLITMYMKDKGFVIDQYFTTESLNDLEIVRDVRAAGLEVHHINFIFQQANELAELHIDNGNDPRHASFNLPLKHCEGSKVVWIRPDQFPKKPPQKNEFEMASNKAKKRDLGSLPTDVKVIRDDSTWDIVDEVDTNQPIVLKTDTWHAVDNRGNNNYRFVFALRFDKNPEFEEVVSKLSNIGI